MKLLRLTGRFSRPVIKQTLRLLIYGSIGSTLALLAVFIWYFNNQPDLQPWHHLELDDFTEDSEVASFADYLRLEETLFARLAAMDLDDGLSPGQRRLTRYAPGSISDPARWEQDFNRSYVLTHEEPRIGVLLLHGLSDSPYSMRHLATALHEHGAHTVVARMPGHGTVPAGLVELTWQDMAGVVELAMVDLRKQMGDRPIIVVGYSTGAPLALEYSLRALLDPQLPRAQRLVFLSPAIGVSPAAKFAVWQGRLGHWLGLDKLAWNSVGVEFDPFKYQSFAVNAGDLIHRLTLELQTRLDGVLAQGLGGEIPPILAFQSLVDSTVITDAVVTGLFDRLPAAGHQLVLFDINWQEGLDYLFRQDHEALVARLKDDPTLPYSVHIIKNRNNQTNRVHRWINEPGQQPRSEALDLAWPDGMYSLSHVALPFPEQDPLYGTYHPDPQRINLGNIALRGERGVLRISAGEIVRQRYNPFFAVLLEHLLAAAFADVTHE